MKKIIIFLFVFAINIASAFAVDVSLPDIIDVRTDKQGVRVDFQYGAVSANDTDNNENKQEANAPDEIDKIIDKLEKHVLGND